MTDDLVFQWLKERKALDSYFKPEPKRVIDDYVLNVVRWDGMERYVGGELWIAQKDYDHDGRFTTVKVDPLEWVAPLENGKPICAERFNYYVLYVRKDGELFKEAYKEAE